MLKFLLALIIIVVLGYGIYWGVHFWMRKTSAEVVESDALNDVIRRVQVIDVREPSTYDVSHILGSRNIPSYEFKQRMNELRKDTAIYLYGEDEMAPSRAAYRLKKKGYDNIYILKGGFENWLGRTKSNK